MKNPNNIIWNRPATFRLVVQCVQYYISAHIESNGKTMGDWK